MKQPASYILPQGKTNLIHSATIELLEVIVFVGAFLHISMALSVKGVQKGNN